MLALVAVIASDSLTITSASSDKHQVISAAMKNIITSASIAHMSAAMKTNSASSGKHQVILAGMKTTRSLHGIAAGAGDHHQRKHRAPLGFSDHQRQQRRASGDHGCDEDRHQQLRQVLGCADIPTHQKKFARSLTKVRERRIVRKDVKSGSIGKKL